MASDDTRDPREAVLAHFAVVTCGEPDGWQITEAIDRLDDADPIRTIWPEMVEALDRCVSIIGSLPRNHLGHDKRTGHLYHDEFMDRHRDLLARIREIEGGEHG